MCKRNSAGSESEYQSPLEIMEIQANIFPRYLLIPEYCGKKRGKNSYSIQSLQVVSAALSKLIVFMASNRIL